MREKFEISALAAANFIVHRALSEQSPLTQGRASRLLYLAQARALRERAAKLFEEPIRVGEYGPVIWDVQRAFTRWGGSAIGAPAERYDLSGGVRAWEGWIPTLPLDFWGRTVLQSTWEQEGALSDVELFQLAHRGSGAYRQARAMGASEISVDLMLQRV